MNQNPTTTPETAQRVVGMPHRHRASTASTTHCRPKTAPATPAPDRFAQTTTTPCVRRICFVRRPKTTNHPWSLTTAQPYCPNQCGKRSCLSVSTINFPTTRLAPPRSIHAPCSATVTSGHGCWGIKPHLESTGSSRPPAWCIVF